jgi:hypothetical protein
MSQASYASVLHRMSREYAAGLRLAVRIAGYRCSSIASARMSVSSGVSDASTFAHLMLPRSNSSCLRAVIASASEASPERLLTRARRVSSFAVRKMPSNASGAIFAISSRSPCLANTASTMTEWPADTARRAFSVSAAYPLAVAAVV